MSCMPGGICSAVEVITLTAAFIWVTAVEALALGKNALEGIFDGVCKDVFMRVCIAPGV